MHLLNNLTFAILVTDGGWRTDLTIRFCEYFSHQINGKDFINNIIFPASIDDAISECKTDYLLIQESGHLPFTPNFFSVLEQSIVENSDIFIGKIKLADDYAILEKSCLFINKKLWLENGSPTFVSRNHEGPSIKVIHSGQDKYFPGQIAVDKSVAPGEERVFITGECSLNGADILVKQLDTFGTATAFTGVCNEKDFYFLDASTPYTEIKTETVFEKTFLRPQLAVVDTAETSDEIDLKDLRASVVVAQARGLKPYLLARTFYANTVIIYENNPAALELQKHIFNITVPKLYGEIISEFKNENPDVVLTADWEEYKDVAITPMLGLTPKFVLVDAISFEMEELVRSFDHSQTAVVDLAETFVYPYSYYRRPLYQVQSLFAQVYSALKSRTGPTHILGFAPGYQQMDKVEVNTSMKQYAPEALIPIEDEELTQEMLDEADAPVEEADPTVYVPATNVEKYSDNVAYTPPLSANKVVANSQPTFKTPEIKVEQLASIDVMTPMVATLTAIKEQSAVTPEVKIVEVKVEPKVEEVKVAQVVIPLPPVKPKDFTFVAETLGYIRTDGGIRPGDIKLTKQEVFEEFTAILEYEVNTLHATWCFKVSMLGGEKKIEFSNGITSESFLRHLNMPVKINPKTAAKYLK